MHSLQPRSRRPRYRPQMLPLEERLPLGDALLGAAAGLSLLGTQAAPAEPTCDGPYAEAPLPMDLTPAGLGHTSAWTSWARRWEAFDTAPDDVLPAVDSSTAS